MLNKLLKDVNTSQEEGNPFHYVWLLILISLITWFDPPNYKGIDLLVNYMGVRYQNKFT